jgi:hypothetical protein
MKATHRLIDSVWTIEYEIISETEIKVLNFNRDDEEGYMKERELPQCTIVEDDKRTIIEVLVRDTFDSFRWVNRENCDHAYRVVNPQYVFSYKTN